jgi:signal transduction histidine kinase
MARSSTRSLVPPILWGSVLIASCLALATLWNVVIVSDYFQLRNSTGATWAPHLWVLAIGGVLFCGVTTGLVLFLVSLIKQIRTNQAQQNFIDAVTHELKTPLTSLKLHLQTLALGRVPVERYGEFHSIMLQDVDRLDALLDHVLEAAKMVDGPYVKRGLIPVWGACEDAIALISQRYGVNPGCFHLAGDACSVAIERQELNLVLGNLLDNAVKFSNTGVEIQLKVRFLGKKVEITLQDNGIGIPAKHRKRIFQRFYRLGNEITRLRRGTGLGLFIVRETLRQAKGNIRVSSGGEGQGTTFTLTLPGAP